LRQSKWPNRGHERIFPKEHAKAVVHKNHMVTVWPENRTFVGQLKFRPSIVRSDEFTDNRLNGRVLGLP
jgi:hypothetical protein